MRGSLVVSAVALALVAPASAHAFDRPSPGSAGIGDRLFPTLGNGGYDVQHYDLDLRYATSAPSQGIDGTVTLLARATQSLSRFNLDFAGDSVGSVSVNGLPAKYHAATARTSLITPKLPLLKGLPFVVQVSHYTAHPVVPDPNNLLGAPFFITPDGSATAGQPDGTHPSCRPTIIRATRRRTRSASTCPPASRRSPTAAALQEHLGRPHALRVPDAPADGDRADPARGRPAIRRSTAAATTACRSAT